ncbi:MAG: hypothetical protein F2896_02340 [Actinobacteria bacterium]|jgi:hypothetical protein|uniref:Unannotated protein n=1 Tax=freshwater metagenome TaxID=449393 RepID=A0A6J5Z203_9ZZZZ|nr:hypothetical protein [Actinomycetota bacterium]
MTTETYESLAPIHKPYLQLISSTEDPALWSHPVLDIFAPPKREFPQQKAKLYLVPSTFGEDIDFDEMPIPTSATELPELHAWTMKFIVSVLEIWAGRRQPAQLIRSCHRVIYMELLRKTGSQKDIGRIRNIHQTEPLDGICESTVTVRYGDRLRAVVIRFEGVDGRWLCTALRLI